MPDNMVPTVGAFDTFAQVWKGINGILIAYAGKAELKRL
jgi:hypothetical protein